MPPTRTEIMQGTLDLMVLQTLNAMGPLHGYGIAKRIEQISGQAILVNQGTIYLCLVRLVQNGWLTTEWGASENGRRARFYSLSASGRKQLKAELENWQRISGVIAKLIDLTSELAAKA